MKTPRARLPLFLGFFFFILMWATVFAKTAHTGATPPASPVTTTSDVVSTAEKNGPPPIPVPPVNARIWTLQDGLTVIVQEDHSAPVASVQAWCQTGSIDEDKHLGAGLSHI